MAKQDTIDIRTVDRNTLEDIRSVNVDPSAPRMERIRSFLSQIRNPYLYRDGNVVVSINFADTDVTLEERIAAYSLNLK